MAKLSYLKEQIDAYLQVKGDKELLSVSSCNGSETEFILNLADIYDGPIGSNPYSGRDSITLVKEEAKAEEPQNESRDQLKAFFTLEDRLRKDNTKDTATKLAVLWGALSVMQGSGGVGMNKARALWTEFALELMDLE